MTDVRAFMNRHFAAVWCVILAVMNGMLIWVCQVPVPSRYVPILALLAWVAGACSAFGVRCSSRCLPGRFRGWAGKPSMRELRPISQASRDSEQATDHQES